MRPPSRSPAADTGSAEDDRAATSRRCSSSTSWSRNIRARAHRGARQAVPREGQLPEAETFRAVDGISFTIERGESVGLVGESGCGKSTTSMMVMRLLDQTSGTHHVRRRGHRRDPGQGLRAAAAAQAHPDGVPGSDRQPQSALHRGARHRRSDPAARRHQGRATRCARAARNWRGMVGLPVDLLDRFPHQLSGGQKARVGIARAIALNPELVILDEPTAALDVSVQAVVLNLLQDLKAVARHELSVRVARSQRGAPAVRPRHRDADRPDRRAGHGRAGAGDAARSTTPRNCWRRFRIRRCEPVMPSDRSDPIVPSDDERSCRSAGRLYRRRRRGRWRCRSSAAWRPAVRANLEVIADGWRALVDEFPLPDEAEPAPCLRGLMRHDRRTRRG